MDSGSDVGDGPLVDTGDPTGALEDFCSSVGTLVS